MTWLVVSPYLSTQPARFGRSADVRFPICQMSTLPKSHMKWCVGPLHLKSPPPKKPTPPPPPPNFGALGAYGESQGYYSSALSLHYRIYHGQNIEKKYTEIFQGGKKLEG